jgi:hypothetical protein
LVETCKLERGDSETTQILARLETKTDPGLLDTWFELINEYSFKKLTNQADKLVAVAGLAEDLGRIWDGSSYFAGIWAYRLHSGLLWEAREPFTRRTLNTAPSWSWASLEGGVMMTINEHCEGLVEILAVDMKPAMSSQPFGSVTGGTIRFRGPLTKATFVRKGDTSYDWEIDFFPDQSEPRSSPPESKPELCGTEWIWRIWYGPSPFTSPPLRSD